MVYRYQPDERKWWMTLVNDPTVWAVSNASMKSLIMGETKFMHIQSIVVMKSIARTTSVDDIQ